MAKVICYPIGNADTTLIQTNDQRLILIDHCNYPLEGERDKRVELDKELKRFLKEKGRSDFDVVAFTHLDDDHVHGAEEFFYLDHAEKYQGKERIKLKELHVPASTILEEGTEGSAKIIRAEARHRLKKGSGIRVYGEPEPLISWLKEQKIDPANRERLITRAGSVVPGFSQTKGQLEIFVHAPFSFMLETEKVARNETSLVWHLTFFEGTRKVRFMMGADALHPTWANIVYITKKKGNKERLEWDGFRNSHHTSYTALGPDKGKDETKPIPEVEELFGYGTEGSVIISSSDPIPEDDTVLPPHQQAAAYYRRIARKYGSHDNFVVTMEHPSPRSPKPMVIDIGNDGLKVSKRLTDSGIPAIISRPSPRVG